MYYLFLYGDSVSGFFVIVYIVDFLLQGCNFCAVYVCPSWLALIIRRPVSLSRCVEFVGAVPVDLTDDGHYRSGVCRAGTAGRRHQANAVFSAYHSPTQEVQQQYSSATR